MKKKEKFLKKLEECLSKINKKDRENIIDKYSKLIDEEKEKGKRIVDILKKLGTAEDVALNEIQLYKDNKKSIFTIILEFIKNIFKKISTKIKSRKTNKDKSNKISIETKDISSTKEKSALKKFFDKFKKTKKEKRKENTKKTNEDYKEEKTKIVEPDYIEEKDNTIIENKKEDNIVYVERYVDDIKLSLRIFYSVIFILLIIFWFWLSVVTVASLFAILDGIKFYGIPMIFFGLDLVVLTLIFYFNKKISKRKINRLRLLILIVLCVLISAIGAAFTIKDIYNIKITDDINEKYNMTKKELIQFLPDKKEEKLHISFNSNYKTKYDIQYVDNIDGKIKIETKYYECYYDYFTKKQGNNIYISLKPDKRDRLSVYISDLKEGKIYNNDEFERYILTIKGSKKDLERVVID